MMPPWLAHATAKNVSMTTCTSLVAGASRKHRLRSQALSRHAVHHTCAMACSHGKSTCVSELTDLMLPSWRIGEVIQLKTTFGRLSQIAELTTCVVMISRRRATAVVVPSMVVVLIVAFPAHVSVF